MNEDSFSELNSIAVVSLGSIGRRHVQTVKNVLPDCHVYAVRTGNGKKCEEENLLDGVYLSTTDVLKKKIDAAIICSPASLHAEFAIPFLRKDIPVLIEKPLAGSYKDAYDILLESEITKAYVAYVLRHHPAFKKVYNVTNTGVLGKIRSAEITVRTFLPDWRPGIDFHSSVSAQKALGGGVLRELSHEIDYAQKILGDFVEVFGYRNKHSDLNIDVEEQVTAILSTSNRIHAQMVLDFASQFEERHLKIIFDNGAVIWNLLDQSVTVFENGKEKALYDYKITRDQLFQLQFKSFIKTVKGIDTDMPTIEEGLKVLSIIEGCEKSFIEGLPVKLL